MRELLVLALACVAAGLKPHRKALWNMGSMSECHLQHSGLVYNGYGCFCGMGGSGSPVDQIDTCCMNHDHCYEAAVKRGDCFATIEEYLDDYDWLCVDHRVHCKGEQSACASALCDCDKKVVECWGQYPKPTSRAKCVEPEAHKGDTEHEL